MTYGTSSCDKGHKSAENSDRSVWERQTLHHRDTEYTEEPPQRFFEFGFEGCWRADQRMQTNSKFLVRF